MALESQVPSSTISVTESVSYMNILMIRIGLVSKEHKGLYHVREMKHGKQHGRSTFIGHSQNGKDFLQ